MKFRSLCLKKAGKTRCHILLPLFKPVPFQQPCPLIANGYFCTANVIECLMIFEIVKNLRLLDCQAEPVHIHHVTAYLPAYR